MSEFIYYPGEPKEFTFQQLTELLNGEVPRISPYGSLVTSEDTPITATNKTTNTVILFGDSMTGQNHRSYFGSSQVLTLSRTNNVVTVQITAHGKWTGSKIRIAGVPEDGFNGDHTITRVDADNMTFQSVGPDVAATRSSCMVMDLAWRSTAGYFFWLQLALRGRLKLIRNSGVNGQTTAQMLARVQEDVIAYNPHFAINLGGYNDLIHGLTKEQTLQNMLDIALAQSRAGIIPVVLTPVPIGSGAATFNTTNVQHLRYVARGLLAAQSSGAIPGMLVVDVHDVLVDRNNTVNIGAAKTGVLSDEIHPAQRGGKLIGESIGVVMGPVSPLTQRLPSSYADVTTSGTGGYNVVKAGPYTTSGGTTTSPPVTGTTAASITTQRAAGTTGSAVASVQTLADGSLVQQLVITPGGAETWTMRSNDGAAVSVLLTGGEVRRLVAYIKISGITAGAPFQDFTFNFNFVVDGITYYHYATLSTTTNVVNSDIEGVLVSDPVEVPLGSITNCGWRFDLRTSAAGSDITAQVGRVGYLLEA